MRQKTAVEELLDTRRQKYLDDLDAAIQGREWHKALKVLHDLEQRSNLWQSHINTRKVDTLGWNGNYREKIQTVIIHADLLRLNCSIQRIKKLYQLITDLILTSCKD